MTVAERCRQTNEQVLRVYHRLCSPGDVTFGSISLGELVEDVIRLYPEAYAVTLVGSYARGEANEASDLDILIRFRKGTNGWDMVLRDSDLWRKYKKANLGVVPDFIIHVDNEGCCGEHEWRIENNLPTPEIILWQK